MLHTSPTPRFAPLAVILGGLLAAPLAVQPLAAQESPEPPVTVTVQRSQLLMGTLLTVDIEADSRETALAASEQIFDAVAEAEARLSTWRDDSELSHLNASETGQAISLSPALAMDLSLAARCVELTDGAFDPTVGRRSAAVGFAHLDLDGDTARRQRADLRLDAGGFGKGAGLDDAVARLRSDERVHSARLDFGGQLMIYRSETGAVQVAHPEDRGRIAAEFAVSDGSVATTGQGQKPGHVLDPRTGRPAFDFGSLTVWTDEALERSATLADCLSTGLYVLGPDAALDFAARHDGVEVLVAEPSSEGVQIRASAGLTATPAHSISTFAAAATPGAASTTRDDEPYAATHGSSPR